MLVWRLYVERRPRWGVWWLGPCHTYLLWPRYVKADRANW